MLRQSADERAQNAYALMVEALVSGEADAISKATAAMQEAVPAIASSATAPHPSVCNSEDMRPLHQAAEDGLAMCGISLSSTEVPSEARERETRRAMLCLAIVVVGVLMCVFVHATVQRCKPSALCEMR